MYTRIVVPLDGSKLAEQALAEAEHLASLTGTPLHLVQVVDFTPLARYGPYGLAATGEAYSRSLVEAMGAARVYLAPLVERLATRGWTVTSEVRQGAPVDEVINVTEPGDLIVMATHGRGGPARWFLGSVAESVVRRSPVPVLLVRARDASRPDEMNRANQPVNDPGNLRAAGD